MVVSLFIIYNKDNNIYKLSDGSLEPGLGVSSNGE